MRRVGPIAFHASRLLLGALFLYAGVIKGMDVRAFAGQVAAYRLLPELGNLLVALTLPYVEALAGLLLLAGARVRAAALVCGVLTLAFVAVLGSAVVRGLDLDCGCFGQGGVSPVEALIRDAGILVLVVMTFMLRAGKAEAGARSS